MKQIFLGLFFTLLLNSFVFGQGRGGSITTDTADYPLEVELDFNNKSPDINDGFIVTHVFGGKAPYKYYWSKNDLSLNSTIGEGFIEGKKYFLTVYDSANDSVTKEFTIPAKSINEKLNSALVPAVDVMNKILMADIFALLHIYDPVIHDDNGAVLRHPNGDPMKMKIPLIVVWLIIGALYFTIYMRFINFTGFKLAIQHVAGKFDKKGHKGEVSHFQALTTALSATVGLGNIAGVAIAISIGGPGATFWMIIAGLLGMSTKFVECTLGVKYRDIDKNGVVSGGPMYYISKTFKKKNMGGFGKVLAVIFAILIIGGSFGGGNMFQANQSFAQLANMFPTFTNYGALYGVILAALVGVVVIGGIKSIAKVTDKIVPFMAAFYVLVALIIIIINIDKTGEAFKLIYQGAFASEALKGGIIGVMIVGFQRAAFSNEAGVGSASVAHSAVKTDNPVTEGLVSLLEPFIDTVVICTMTALVIIFTGFYDNPLALDGVQLTSAAFGSVFSWFPYLLVIAIMLFAFSTMISWSYMMILSMAFPNIIALYFLAGEVKGDLRAYLKKIKSGEIEKNKIH